jgi:hypothetical protein
MIVAAAPAAVALAGCRVMALAAATLRTERVRGMRGVASQVPEEASVLASAIRRVVTLRMAAGLVEQPGVIEPLRALMPGASLSAAILASGLISATPS